jgi:hypothetical protein
MSSKAGDNPSKQQQQQILTAEGLGGVNIKGLDDPRTKTGLPNVGEAKASDPDWVQRKNPEDMPRYMTTKATGSEKVAGEGVGYDPGSSAVATLEDTTPQRSSGASGSQTGLLPRNHELGGHGDPAAFGSVGAETQYGHKQRDRAAAGDDTKINREDFGRSSETREKAGTEVGIKGEELHRGFDVNPPR